MPIVILWSSVPSRVSSSSRRSRDPARSASAARTRPRATLARVRTHAHEPMAALSVAASAVHAAPRAASLGSVRARCPAKTRGALRAAPARATRARDVGVRAVQEVAGADFQAEVLDVRSTATPRHPAPPPRRRRRARPSPPRATSRLRRRPAERSKAPPSAARVAPRPPRALDPGTLENDDPRLTPSLPRASPRSPTFPCSWTSGRRGAVRAS